MNRIFFYPCRPRGQGRPRFSGKVAYKSGEDKAYEQGIRMAYFAAYPGYHPIGDPVAVDVTAIYPIPDSASKARKSLMLEGAVLPISRPDVDNILKSVLDALNGAAYTDDKNAVECRIRKVYGNTPGLLVTIAIVDTDGGAWPVRGKRRAEGGRKMNVILIACTPNPDWICAQAATICTDWKGDPIQALKGALASGHESVAEHASFTFLIERVSRALLAQITRHRLASFSVQSQRYVDMGQNGYVMPPSIANDSEQAKTFDNAMEIAWEFYDRLVEMGIPKEDARYVLPNACHTTMEVTMNARELRHFFSLRCCNRAQWEIRQLADEMLKLCKDAAPVLFSDSGPGCVRGKCPEGKRACGKTRKG